MSESLNSQPFPRLPLIGAAILVGTTILLAATVRLTGIGASHEVDAPTLMERSLRFEDKTDGSIMVVDTREGKLVDQILPGTNGFLRGTLRGLSRERRRQGIDAGQPFQLISRADGRLTLLDLTTDRRVDLESFGPTNTEAFRRLLTAGKQN